MTEPTALEVSDAKAEAVAVTPNRISLASIQAKIDTIEFINPPTAPHITLCILKTKAGYVVVGEAAPADPANYNEELGKEFAHEAAIRKLWPLEGYNLVESLAAGAGEKEAA